MRKDNAVPEETLLRLWSEVAMLRKEIEQAERHEPASLAPAVMIPRARVSLKRGQRASLSGQTASL